MTGNEFIAIIIVLQHLILTYLPKILPMTIFIDLKLPYHRNFGL